MKKLISCILCLFLLCGTVFCAQADETKEYRDAVYSFRYPASWSCDTSGNGDIILGAPDGKSGVITFALISDLWTFTGDALTDAPTIESYIASYGGKNLALTGEYEPAQSGILRGFRAAGSWRASGQDAVMLILSGDRHMVGFVLVGDEAIALEQELLDSVELTGDAPAESGEGFLRWENAQAALDYPAGYGMMEQTTGAAFINPDNSSCIIMARIYTLDIDYSDALAPTIAANALPKSTKVEANPEMTVIGGRNAAVITGTVAGGPMSFYVIGSGRTVLALMFTGEEACGMAEHVIMSAEIK